MTMMRCVAIDDEPIALSILKKYCEEYGDMEFRGFDSPEEGMDFVEGNPPDLLFLDIEMQPVNGLELARRLPKDVCLIFTTAYREYALEGFELNAVDYLQKPLLYPRFEKAMRKAKRWMGLEEGFITINVEHQKVRVNLSEILYVEAMDNYIKIHRDGMPMLVTLMTMKELMEMLPSDRFMRIHRSYIVALSKVESVGSKGVAIRGIEEPLPIGRTYLKEGRNLF